jgi:polyhydroxybutyrate depolymerase
MKRETTMPVSKLLEKRRTPASGARPYRRAGLFVTALVLALMTAAQALAADGGPAIRSSGCNVSPPEVPPAALTVDGRERPVLLVAGDADPQTPRDLVIAFHGRTNSNMQARAYYDPERYAQRPTIFVYPTGLPTETGSRSWNDAGDSPGQLRDYELFDAILLRVARLYCIDLGRVFAVGHSLGASFVNSLACARGGKLRGIATVAGDIGLTECSGPVAAILFHSMHDELVSIRRGEAVRDRLVAVNGLRGPSAPLPVRRPQLRPLWAVRGQDPGCLVRSRPHHDLARQLLPAPMATRGRHAHHGLLRLAAVSS